MQLTFKKNIYYFSLITTWIYIIFRVFFTLPNKINVSIVFAIIVLLIEIIDAFFFAIYVFNILVKDCSIPKEPKLLKKDYPELDVFIATINEDVELIEGTINACKRMSYPTKNKIHIYLCDDGHRKEMEELCTKYKIGYITRNNNKDAKAGNYNNALKLTSSPYVVVFDADMRPTKDFLIKSVPYLFLEENIGFVQLPQSFEDSDLFQRKFKLSGYIPFEQDYFYHRIQLSRNNNNSVIFCGTNAILSRKALDSVGGFATETITEDFATGLMLERNGFKGVALPFDLAFGKNVRSVFSLIKQRSRWCRGCLQTYKNYKILYKSGLNGRQKADYLSGIYYWFFGIRNIIYFLVPLLYSFFGIKIIQGNLVWFVILFFIQFVIKRFVIDILEERKVSSAWNRIYETILTPIVFLESILEIAGFSNKRFEVTIKKENNNKSLKNYYLVFSHIILFVLTFAGLYFSIKKGLTDGFINFLIPIFWLGTNCIYLLFALIFDFSNSNDLFLAKERKCYNYSFFSLGLLLFRFVVKEIKIKRIAIICSIVMFIGFGLLLKNYYQYQKGIVIKQEALVSYNGQLSIDDGNIVNRQGEIVHLRGVSTHNLKWFGRIYTKENIKEIVDTWGVNAFRIAVYTNPFEGGYIADKNQIKEAEKIIDYCIDLDIYVIIDWHILKDNNPNIYKKEAIEFFEILSKKYGNVPNVIYEICNEPNGEEVTWKKDIKPYAEELVKIIRKNSKKSLIIVGLADWCKDISSALKNLLEDENVLYSVHFYAGANGEKLKKEISKAKEKKMPLIVTECGPTDESGDGNLHEEYFDEWIRFLEDKNISWIIWQFSEKDEASSLLIKKEVQDRLDFLYEKYTEEELENKKYYVNDYLSDTGKFIKNILLKYS